MPAIRFENELGAMVTAEEFCLPRLKARETDTQISDALKDLSFPGNAWNTVKSIRPRLRPYHKDIPTNKEAMREWALATYPEFRAYRAKLEARQSSQDEDQDRHDCA